MIVLRYLNCMKINIVLYVNVKEDVHTRLRYNSDWTTIKTRTNCPRMVREIEPWSLTKKWFDQFFTISDHFWKKIIFFNKWSEMLKNWSNHFLSWIKVQSRGPFWDNLFLFFLFNLRWAQLYVSLVFWRLPFGYCLIGHLHLSDWSLSLLNL